MLSPDCLPGCPVIHILSHVAKAQMSLVRCQTNEVFLSKGQPALVRGRWAVMSQGRADKLWFGVKQFPPLFLSRPSTDLGCEFMCVFPGTCFLLP